jgi:hypothetical protein
MAGVNRPRPPPISNISPPPISRKYLDKAKIAIATILYSNYYLNNNLSSTIKFKIGYLLNK